MTVVESICFAVGALTITFGILYVLHAVEECVRAYNKPVIRTDKDTNP